MIFFSTVKYQKNRLNFFSSLLAICKNKCLNGAKCIQPNKCQCTPKFKGPTCQTSVDRCDVKKTGFNGSFKCTDTAVDTSCTLSCAAGAKFQKPPAKVYKCKFAENKFLPAPIPKCLPGKTDPGKTDSQRRSRTSTQTFFNNFFNFRCSTSSTPCTSSSRPKKSCKAW